MLVNDVDEDERSDVIDDFDVDASGDGNVNIIQPLM